MAALTKYIIERDIPAVGSFAVPARHFPRTNDGQSLTPDHAFY